MPSCAELADPTNPSTAVNRGTFPSGLGTPLGITSDDGSLWILDDSGAELWELADPTNPSTAVNRGGFPSGLTNPQGITSHDADPADPSVELTIARDQTTVVEGTDATWTITADTAPSSDLTVNAAVTESGSYIDGTAPTIVTLSSGDTTATLTVPTLDDSADEPNGSITATLETGTGYTLGSATAATINVTDNDDPDLIPSFGSSTVPNQSYTQNTAITALQLDAATGGDGTLVYSISGEPAGVTLNTSRQLVGTPTATGTTTVTYTVTDDDGDSDTLTFTITVNEPDLMPSLPSIADQTATVGEEYSQTLPIATGGDAPLSYSVSGEPPGFTFNTNTNVLSGTPTAAGTSTVTLTVEDDDGDTDTSEFDIVVSAAAVVVTIDSVSDQTGEVVRALITVGHDQNWYSRKDSDNLGSVSNDSDIEIDASNDVTRFRRHGTTNEFRLFVSGGDAGAVFGAGTPGESARIDIATPYGDINTSGPDIASGDRVSFTLTQTQYDILSQVVVDDQVNVVVSGFVTTAVTPEITIAAGTTPITEGTDATWTITASITPVSDLTVNIDVSETGDTISGTAPTTVTLSSGDTSATLTVPTEDDSVDETDSVITATLETGTGYVLGSTTTADVTVEDDDDPADLMPSFSDNVFTQNYTQNVAISTLQLPAATGGDGTLAYSLPSRPPGINFNATTRQMTGTPTATGTTLMTYTVTDEDGDTDTLNFNIIISAPADLMPTLPSIADQTATVDEEFSLTFTGASGGDLPIAYSVSGNPSWLTLSGLTLSGTPTATGTNTVTVTVEDDDGDTDTATFDLVVSAASEPTAGNSQTFPVGSPDTLNTTEMLWDSLELLIDSVLVVGGAEAYFSYLRVRNSGGYLTVALRTAPDLTTGSTGAGPNLTPEWESYAVAITISAGGFSLTIGGPETGTLTDDTEEPYSYIFLNTGQTSADGIAFIADFNALTQAQRDATTVTLADGATTTPDLIPDFGSEDIADQTYTQNVAITALQLPAATGGDGTLAYSISGEPAGVTLNASRQLVGTPTATGTTTVTYTVTDDDGDSDTIVFTVTVNAPVDLMPTLPAILDQTATVGTDFSLTFTAATGGDLPVAYTVSGNPSWLTLSNRTLSGTPDATGTHTVTVTVEDDDGDTDTSTFDIVVSAAAIVITIDSIADQTGEVVRALITVGHVDNWYSRRGSDNLGSVSNDSDIEIDASNDVTRFRRHTTPAEFRLFVSGGNADAVFGTGNPGENAQVDIATPYGDVVITVPDSFATDRVSFTITAAQVVILSQVVVDDLVNVVVSGFATTAVTPEITIVADTTPVTEGTDATWTITASEAPGADLVVNVDVSETGDAIDGTAPTTVTISDGNTEATLTIPTDADSVDEIDSVITAIIETGTGYTVGTNNIADVTVEDDDLPPDLMPALPAIADQAATVGIAFSLTVTAATGGDTPLAYTASGAPSWLSLSNRTLSGTPDATGTHTITVTVTDSDGDTDTATFDLVVSSAAVPQLTIAADQASVVEGTNVTFTVTSSIAPSANLNIHIVVTEAGDVIDVTPPASVTILSGQTTATLTVTTEDDAVDEVNGSVTATIQTGTGYTVGSASAATTAVTDNDDPVVVTPELTIARDLSTVVEGTDATWTITADTAPSADLTVNVDVTQSGSISTAHHHRPSR